MLQDSKKYQYNDYMKEYITRIVNILNGKLKYDPKREFTTTQKIETNLIEKRGELEKYSKEVLKMYFGASYQSHNCNLTTGKTLCNFSLLIQPHHK